jgi:hypothetical protein
LFALANRIEARLSAAQRLDKVTANLECKSIPHPASRHLLPVPGGEGSLLARAFRSQLVPQYPTDEPAEKLLEQIRA